MHHRSPFTWALGAILLLAGTLRFAGLSFGLRHTPHWDERCFVEEAVFKMRLAGDLDHRFYEYPGLFVYMLHAVLLTRPLEIPPGPSWYLWGRGFVALCGVASVALVFLLGRRLAGPWAGIAAALFLAVSPVEVVTAHMIRPDVTLEAAALLGLLAFTRLGEKARGDVLAGMAIGVAGAIKFTGVLLAPSYLVARGLAPGPKIRRIALAALVSLGVFVATTPYAVIHGRAFVNTVLHVQLAAHYDAPLAAPPGYLELVRYYLGILAGGLGPLGSLMALGGLVLAVRGGSTFAPLLAYPLVTILVMATAQIRYSRHTVPITGAVALLAGLAIAALAKHRPRLAAAALLVAAAFPFAESAAYARTVSQPGTWDRTADWLVTHGAGARVLNPVAGLGLDRQKLEVVPAGRGLALDRRLARHVDYVVWSGPPNEVVSGLRPVFLTAGPRPEAGPPMTVFAVPKSLRPQYVAIPLEPAWLRASTSTAELPALLDGRPNTYWTTPGPQAPGDWIEVTLPAPAVLGRIELGLGGKPLRFGRVLQVMVSEDGETWSRVGAASARAPVEDLAGRVKEPTQVLVFTPLRTRRLRLQQMGTSDRPWGLAELRLDALVAE